MRRALLGAAALMTIVALVPMEPAAADNPTTTVFGRLFDTTDGSGIEDACVVFTGDPGTFQFTSGENGQYAAVVPPGAYKAFTTDCGTVTHDYQSETYRNVPGIDTTNGRTVNALHDVPTTGVDFSLARGGRLSVRVVAEGTGGQPVEGAVVCPEFIDRIQQNTGCAITGPDGVAELIGVPKRNKVNAFGGPIVQEYWKNQGSHDTAGEVFVKVDTTVSIVMRVQLADTPEEAGRSAARASSGSGYEPVIG